MQDPKKEIIGIFRTLCTTKDAKLLDETVTKHFIPEAKFSHAMCKADSRNEMLGLFQWYRLASPESNMQITTTTLDTDNNILFLDIKDKPNVWFNPIPSKDGKMLVRIQLRKMNGYYYIEAVDVLAHPMDQIGFIASPLVPVVGMCLWLGCFVSNLGACVCRNVGLNSGLQGGSVSYVGLMESAGLARMAKDKMNGHANE